jgi:hypothetical protein
MTDEFRRQLAELYREDDALRAERAQEERRCREVRPLVAKNDEGLDLVFRRQENALQPLPREQADVSDETSADDALMDALVVHSKAVGDRVLDLQRENVELRAKLDVVLQMLRVEPSTKRGEVIDLPDWRKRGVA